MIPGCGGKADRSKACADGIVLHRGVCIDRVKNDTAYGHSSMLLRVHVPKACLNYSSQVEDKDDDSLGQRGPRHDR